MVLVSISATSVCVKPYASLHRAGANLRGLVRVLLFKRFESSVFAIQETIRRFLKIHNTFLKALDDGFVPADRTLKHCCTNPIAKKKSICSRNCGMCPRPTAQKMLI